MKKLLLILCLLAHVGFSQTVRIDSLKRELRRLEKQPQGYARDTLRCQAVKAIMDLYSEINIDSSVRYSLIMIRLCTNQRFQQERIYAYQFAGYLYQVKGAYHKSVQFYYKALILAEKLRNYSRIARSYGGLAHAYASLKKYEKATQACLQGLDTLRKYPNGNSRLAILNVLGSVYREQRKLVEALSVNQEMYKLAQVENDQWYEAQGLHAIGWVYQEMSEQTNALAYYKKSLTLSREIGSIDLEASILLHIADIYTRQEKWSEALLYCNQAKGMAIRAKNSSIVKEADESLYKLFKQTGQSAKALKAHEDFITLKDSLSKEETEQRIEMLQAQYDNVQKTNALQRERMNGQAEQSRSQQIRNGLFLGIVTILIITALLFGNNRRLKAKNLKIDQQRILLETAHQQLADINKTLETRVEERTKELVSANRELTWKNEEIKEALFKGQTIERKRVALELHDNLSSLLSAVNMSIQSINPQHLSEKEQSVYRNVKQLIQNAYAEVRNISHNILPAELEREGLATTLNTLINQLNQNSSLQFSLTATSLQTRLPVEIEFNVYSIVLELINNAIKHAKASTVDIRLFRTNIGVNISVIDDGIGLGQHHGKRGVGLQNVQTRLDSLGGTFNVLLPTEKGTRILIKIPIETVSINGDERMI